MSVTTASAVKYINIETVKKAAKSRKNRGFFGSNCKKKKKHCYQAPEKAVWQVLQWQPWGALVGAAVTTQMGLHQALPKGIVQLLFCHFSERQQKSYSEK